MIKIDVFVKDKNWKRYLPNPRRYLNNQAKKINLRNYLNPKSINISVLLTGNNGIRILNRKFRKKNKTTDILSFPNYNLREAKVRFKSKKDIYLGDIVLNLYKINTEKKNFKKEFNKLWIHGLVHLLGHKHYKNKDYFKMKKIENKFFKKLKC